MNVDRPSTEEIETIDVRGLRERMKLGQDDFARRFGLSLRTLQQWEQGRRVPDGPGRVLLRIIDRDADAAARALTWLPADETQYDDRVGDVKSLVMAMLPDAVYAEKQQRYPSFRLGSRLVTVGIDFWPCTQRSCILVTGREHRWFGFEDAALTVAECVVDGLVGPLEQPPMTFERYVGVADHAMRSVLASRARVELQTGVEMGREAYWRGQYARMRLSLVSEFRLRAEIVMESGVPAPPPMDDYLENGSAVRFGARDLATLFAPRRRR